MAAVAAAAGVGGGDAGAGRGAGVGRDWLLDDGACSAAGCEPRSARAVARPLARRCRRRAAVLVARSPQVSASLPAPHRAEDDRRSSILRTAVARGLLGAAAPRTGAGAGLSGAGEPAAVGRTSAGATLADSVVPTRASRPTSTPNRKVTHQHDGRGHEEKNELLPVQLYLVKAFVAHGLFSTPVI